MWLHGAPPAQIRLGGEIAEKFRGKVDLRVAKIVEIKRHPDAEKLYVETVDLGTEKRTIVSGLVPHYTEEELLGHNVVLVANLKPALLRGVESAGMLLAAQEGKTVEVLFVDHAAPGDRVVLSGAARSTPIREQIDIDTFFTMPICRGRLPGEGRRCRALLRRQARGDNTRGEGQGEIIEVSVRPAAPGSLDAGDELLQSGFWAGFKAEHGWKAHAFAVEGLGDPFGMLVLSRTLLRRFTLAYIPFGPVRDPLSGRGELLSALARALRPHLPAPRSFSGSTFPGRKRARIPEAAAAGPLW